MYRCYVYARILQAKEKKGHGKKTKQFFVNVKTTQKDQQKQNKNKQKMKQQQN